MASALLDGAFSIALELPFDDVVEDYTMTGTELHGPTSIGKRSGEEWSPWLRGNTCSDVL